MSGLVGEPGDSDGEAKLVEWLVEAGLPLPEQQVWVTTPTGSRYCLDLAYAEAKIDIEYDGGDHADPAQMLHDRTRDDELILMGYAVVRATKRTTRATFLRRVQRELDARRT